MIKITEKELTDLVDKGLNDREIGNMYGVIPQSIHFQRKKYKIVRSNYRYVDGVIPSNEELQVLFGCLLGDGYMRRNSCDRSPAFSCGHSPKQKEYVLHKAKLLSNLGYNVKEHTRKTPDKKTGKFYSDVCMYLGVNKHLNWMFDAFYGNGKKRIPLEFLKQYYTPLAMAIHFMDDGSAVKGSGYSFATCGFNKEDLLIFSEFLKETYDLDNTVNKANRIYIKNNSRDKFKSLVKPFIIDSMLYKLYD